MSVISLTPLVCSVLKLEVGQSESQDQTDSKWLSTSWTEAYGSTAFLFMNAGVK